MESTEKLKNWAHTFEEQQERVTFAVSHFFGDVQVLSRIVKSLFVVP